MQGFQTNFEKDNKNHILQVKYKYHKYFMKYEQYA